MSIFKCVTGEVKFAFPHLSRPHQSVGGYNKYGIVALFQRDDHSYNGIMDALKQAYNSIEWNGRPKALSDLKLPVMLGQDYRKDDPWFKGMVCMEASSLKFPIIVDAKGNTIDCFDIKAGCYGKLSVYFEPYKKDGEYVGIGCRLLAIQKTLGDDEFAYSTDDALADFGVTSDTPF